MLPTAVSPWEGRGFGPDSGVAHKVGRFAGWADCWGGCGCVCRGRTSEFRRVIRGTFNESMAPGMDLIKEAARQKPKACSPRNSHTLGIETLELAPRDGESHPAS